MKFFIFIVNKNVLYKQLYIPVIWNPVSLSFYATTHTDFGRMVKVGNKTLKPFQGGTSFVDHLCFFFLSCICYAFVHVCLVVPFGHLLGKGWPLGSSLCRLIVSLSLCHWYPGSGVVLDCIDS